LGEEWSTWLDAWHEPRSLAVLGLNILVLRGGALGDLVLTLPVLGEIRKSNPDANVVLLGIFPQARLAMPEFVDRVERLDAPDWIPLFVDGPLPQGVRNRLDGFDLAVCFLSDPDAVIARNLAAAGVKQVVASSNRIRSDVHAVYQLAEVLGQLGSTLQDPVPKLAVRAQFARSSRLGFHVGSGSPQKNWPIDHWIELTQRLDGFFGDFLLLGGEADDKVVREFRARSSLQRLGTLLNASLADLCEALCGCTVFVGHDTGVTHLAAAVGTPTVALFGPTNPKVWAPLGQHVSVVWSTDGLMQSIPVAEAAKETSRRLGATACRRAPGSAFTL
jgi:heptosyltransferase III